MLYGATSAAQGAAAAAAGAGAGALLDDEPGAPGAQQQLPVAAGVCGLCREAAEDPILSGCRHAFCRACMREYLQGIGRPASALLRDLTNDEAAFIGGEADAAAIAADDAAAAAGGDGHDVGEEEEEEEEAEEEDDDEDDAGLGGGGGRSAAGAGAKRKRAAGASRAGGGGGSGSATPKAPRGGGGNKKRGATPAAAAAASAGSGKKAGGKAAAAAPAAAPAAAAPGDGEEDEGEGPALTCPTCYAPLTVNLAAPPALAAADVAVGGRKGILSRVPADRVGGGFRSSTKIEALLEEVWRAQEEEPGAKFIVFSQFVSFLELTQHRLAGAGVRCVKLEGSMSVPARDRVIDAFRNDPFVTVFLMSLKAGGVALNLTSACRVVLMDCWW